MAENSEARFSFGKNWRRYIRSVGAREIASAGASLEIITNEIDPSRARFLDIGSGSGLFSLAAHNSGFAQIVSFDYDADSVTATAILRDSAGAQQPHWVVRQGSVLDRSLMGELGQFDVVYSWGVLHHTGAMWDAIENAANAVSPGGRLFIALYNHQGWISSYWHLVKRTYVHSPAPIRLLMLLVFWSYFGVGLFLADVIRLRNPFKRHTGDGRGMKFFTDVIDWVGGYPFEAARPDDVRKRLAGLGFSLRWEKLVGHRHGCNEFYLQRDRDIDE